MTCAIDNIRHCVYDDDYALSVAPRCCLEEMHSCRNNAESCAPSRSSWETAHISVASCSASRVAIGTIPGLDLTAKLNLAELCDYASDRTTEAGDASPRSIISACDEPCEMGNDATRRTLWADLEDSDEEQDKAEVGCATCIGTSGSTQVEAQIEEDEDKDEKGTSAMGSTRPSRALRRARRAAAQAAERAEAGWKMDASENCKSDSSNWWGNERGSNYTSKAEAKGAGKSKSAGKGAAKPDVDTKGYGKGGKKGAGKDSGKGKSKGDSKGKGKGDSKGTGKGAGGEKFQCQVLVGIEEDQKFRVVRRMIGSGGEHMKSIAQESGAKLRLRGRGSKFLEGPEQLESEDDLMLCISANDTEGYERAKSAATALIENIHQHYRAYCKKTGIACPTLRVYIHEGYRAGSR